MQLHSSPRGERTDPARPQQKAGDQPGQRAQVPLSLADFWKRIDGQA